jgi:hypothetical protein
MPSNRPRNGTYLVGGRNWKVQKRLTFDTYTVDTVVAPKVKVRYEAQWPNASGNLWVDGVLVSHNPIGEAVDLTGIANSRARELIGDAVIALRMAAQASEAAQAPARDAKAAKAADPEAAQERRVAEALKKLG